MPIPAPISRSPATTTRTVLFARVFGSRKLNPPNATNKLRQRLEAMANVHTAKDFGVDNLPSDAYERMAAAMEDDGEWERIEQVQWFQDAQQRADDNDYFHWKLEYPEAFYDEDGSEVSNPGFDAVIGNPPYVRMEQIKPLKPFLSANYDVHDTRVDLYGYFVERSLELSSSKYGVIVSNKWMRAKYGENLRSLLSNYQVEQILDFGDLEVFPGISTYPAIFVIDSATDFTEEVRVAKFEDLDFDSLSERFEQIAVSLPADYFGSGKWSMGSVDEERVKRTLDNRSKELVSYVTEDEGVENTVDGLGRGVVTGGNDAFVINQQERDEIVSKDGKSEEIIKPLLKGTDLSRYHIDDQSRYLIYAKDGIDIDAYPAVKEHLKEFKDQIGNTATDEEWYELQQDQEEYEDYFEGQKICYPDISKECSFAMDEQGYYLVNTCYFVPSNSYALMGVLNSTPVNWYYQFVTSEYRGGYQRSFTHAIKGLPIPRKLQNPQQEGVKRIGDLAESITNARNNRQALNLDLMDYITPHKEGERLADLSGFQPAQGASESILAETAETKDNLRIGSVSVVNNGMKLVVQASARYKPEDEEEYETDQWGYTETESIPAMEFLGLDDLTRSLAEEFIEYAVDEAGGFANFRENATTTKSIIERLEELTLPEIEGTQDNLNRFLDRKSQAENLEEKINKLDGKIDNLVYELFGLEDKDVRVIKDSISE